MGLPTATFKLGNRLPIRLKRDFLVTPFFHAYVKERFRGETATLESIERLIKNPEDVPLQEALNQYQKRNRQLPLDVENFACEQLG